MTGRYFLAMDLTQQAKSEVARLVQPLYTKISGAKWVKPANYHITLLFLGLQPGGRIRDIRVLAAEAASKQAPFEYQLDSWGFFPNSARAKVVFLGVTHGKELITSLAMELITGAADYIEESPGRFHPHLTVARFRQPPESLALPIISTPIKVSAQEITLFSSELTPSGPIYRVEDKFCFSGIARGE